MTRGRLLRYSRYQLKDFAIERALTVVLLAAVNMIGPITTMQNLPAAARAAGLDSPVAGQVIVIFGSLVVLAILFSGQELISRPRKQGYYRLVLAKPVDPVLFYGQLFLVHLIGTVLLLSLMAALFSVLAFPVAIGHIALAAAIGFVLIGGVGFLISVFLNHDSIVLILLVAASVLMKGYAADETGGLWPGVAKVLIPVDHLIALKPMLVAAPVQQYIYDLIAATRSHRGLSLGASPRAGVSLLGAAQASAAIDGRPYATPDDVKDVAAVVLPHRLIVAPQAEIDGVTSVKVVREILESVAIPREDAT